MAKKPSQKRISFDRSALQDQATRQCFTQSFEEELARRRYGYFDQTPHALNASINDAFHVAAHATLPVTRSRAQRPWIRFQTLGLIAERSRARSGADFQLEKQLNAAITKSAKRDKDAWLNDLAGSGDWAQVRKLRRGFKPQQGRLKDAGGRFVSSEERAQTIAEYLETVQWAV